MKKMINIALVFMVVGVLVCADFVYSKDISALRVPIEKSNYDTMADSITEESLGSKITDSRLAELRAIGQTVAIDDVKRNPTELKAWIRKHGIGRVTINSDWVKKVIVDGSYNDFVETGLSSGISEIEIYNNIVIDLVTQTANALMSSYEETDGVDGIVSIQVSPAAYGSASAMLSYMRQLKDKLPLNVDFKIPATPEGLKAVELAVSEGIRVNVTNLFPDVTYDVSTGKFHAEQFESALGAYLRGLKKYIGNQGKVGIEMLRKQLRSNGSVISVWLRTIDEKADPHLSPTEQGELSIAQAKIIYKLHQEILESCSLNELIDPLASPIRILWCNNRVKVTSRSPVHYIEPLVGKDTISTMTPKTLKAYIDEGDPKLRLTEGLDEAQELIKNVIATLKSKDVTTQSIREEALDKSVSNFAEGYTTSIGYIQDYTPVATEIRPPSTRDL